MEERKHVEILNPFIFCNFDLSPKLSLWIEMESANSSTATMLFSLSGTVMFFLNGFEKIPSSIHVCQKPDRNLYFMASQPPNVRPPEIKPY